MPAALTASLPAGDNPGRLHRLILIEDPDLGVVSVWGHLDRANTWRCQVHGYSRTPDCPHVQAAGALLDWPIGGTK